MISKFINSSTTKPGICNANKLEDLLNPDDNVTLTTRIRTSRYGVQQDATHESDDSSVPFPQQVFSAL